MSELMGWTGTRCMPAVALFLDPRAHDLKPSIGLIASCQQDEQSHRAPTSRYIDDEGDRWGETHLPST